MCAKLAAELDGQRICHALCKEVSHSLMLVANMGKHSTLLLVLAHQNEAVSYWHVSLKACCKPCLSMATCICTADTCSTNVQPSCDGGSSGAQMSNAHCEDTCKLVSCHQTGMQALREQQADGRRAPGRLGKCSLTQERPCDQAQTGFALRTTLPSSPQTISRIAVIV